MDSCLVLWYHQLAPEMYDTADVIANRDIDKILFSHLSNK